MRYFFILGTNPVLSTAEIIALLPGTKFTVTEMYKHAVIVDAAPGETLDMEKLMHRLGGTVKIGEIIAEELPKEPSIIVRLMLQGLAHRVTEVGNATFGLSIYSLESKQPRGKVAKLALKFKNVGMEVKKNLKLAGCASRFVRPTTGAALTSVQVEKNRMRTDGAEFVMLAKENSVMLGKTAVVQPFEAFSKADYGRPERDPKQGMLPPKLARIMVNLTHVSTETVDIALLDPFCGSGTVLTEALRMGFEKLYGSDINPIAVSSTKKNIAWIHANGLAPRESDQAKVFESDSRTIGQHIEPDSIDAIVTEPYLGPPRSGNESIEKLEKTIAELSKLYYEALRAWRPILVDGAPVIMALPVFIVGLKKLTVDARPFEKLGYRLEPLLPSIILSRIGVKETKNHGLMYGRNDQRVWREIVRLRLEKE